MRTEEPRVRLRRWMEAQRQTASTLAREIGLARPSVSLILSGRRRPGLAAALSIERVTGGTVRASEWIGASVDRDGRAPEAA